MNTIMGALKKNISIFMGGTCNESQWRESLKDEICRLLKCPNNSYDYLLQEKKIDLFNPVVKDWIEECQKKEIEKRKTCDYVLYCITPKMTGVYSIAEAVHDSCVRPKKTLFCYINADGRDEFTEGQIKSLNAVSDLVSRNGATCFKSLDDLAMHIATNIVLLSIQRYIK